jgi:hypothetical protein
MMNFHKIRIKSIWLALFYANLNSICIKDNIYYLIGVIFEYLMNLSVHVE